MYAYMTAREISLEKYEKEIHDLIILHDLAKLTEKDFLKKCSKIIGLNLPYPQLRYTYQDDSLNQELIAVVTKLKSKYKIALLSNNNREYCKEFIYQPGLDKLFDVMVISYEVGYRKPQPEIYQILINRLGLEPEEILFVDDDPTKLPPAEAQGLKTLVYLGKETNELLEHFL